MEGGKGKGAGRGEDMTKQKNKLHFDMSLSCFMNSCGWATFLALLPGWMYKVMGHLLLVLVSFWPMPDMHDAL